jgi:amidohydrolase
MDLSKSLKEQAHSISDKLSETRRTIHRRPELGFQERETAKLICNHLRDLEIAFQRDVGRTGVVAVIEGQDNGPTIGLRADMDALPIQEETDAPYTSESPGIMHACGHDAHIACLLGAAELIVPVIRRFKGKVKLIFQPAEEIDRGAKAVIKDGVLSSPRLDAIFGLHVDPAIPVGRALIKKGTWMAAIDTFRISVLGQSGHAAAPHRCIDAIVAGSSIVMNLQSLVSRMIDPVKPVLVTIGTFNAGSAENIIAGRAELTGTARCVDPTVHQTIPDIIETICQHTAASFKAEISLDYRRQIPPLVNDAVMTDRARQSIEAVLGPNTVLDDTVRMGGDDFGCFLAEVPGAYFHLGAGDTNSDDVKALHTSCFDIDERCLPLGAAILAHTALTMLDENDAGFSKDRLDYSRN